MGYQGKKEGVAGIEQTPGQLKSLCSRAWKMARQFTEASGVSSMLTLSRRIFNLYSLAAGTFCLWILNMSVRNGKDVTVIVLPRELSRQGVDHAI